MDYSTIVVTAILLIIFGYVSYTTIKRRKVREEAPPMSTPLPPITEDEKSSNVSPR